MPPRAAALAGFAILAAVAWSGAIGTTAYVGLALAATAAATLVIVRAPAWAYAATLAAWLVAVALLAGLGPPAAWPDALVRGSESLSSGTPATGYALRGGATVVLWIAGAFWIAAALMATRGQRAAALGCAAAPWLVSACVRFGDDAAWEGGVVVLLGALWLLDRRETAARCVLGGAAAAGVLLALLAAPAGSWLGVTSYAARDQQHWSFDPTQSYGPLRGDRRGTVLMRVRASRRSYWRLQALNSVDTSGWTASDLPAPRLPEPRARPAEATVEIRALRTPYLVGPGRIEAVPSGGAREVPFSGGSWRLPQSPAAGYTYRVLAAAVDPSQGQMRRAPAAVDARARYYVAVGAPSGPIAVPALFGRPRDPAADARLRSAGYARTLALARRLAAGARSQAEVVQRVHAFLAQYRYSTRAPDRDRPIDAFLVQDKRGSCQHFAGAAALLLRLAGVPARVAVGFSPGQRDSRGRWVVRDRNAHAWVEVWYQGLGWVAFDPTPPSSDAAGLTAAAWLAPSVGFALLALWGLAAWRRRDHLAGERLLRRLARRSGDVATLRESAGVLGRTIGPRTARLALAAEHARYAGSGARAPSRRTVVRAVRADRGAIAATALLARVAV